MVFPWFSHGFHHFPWVFLGKRLTRPGHMSRENLPRPGRGAGGRWRCKSFQRWAAKVLGGSYMILVHCMVKRILYHNILYIYIYTIFIYILYNIYIYIYTIYIYYILYIYIYIYTINQLCTMHLYIYIYIIVSTCSFLNRFSWWHFKSQEALGIRSQEI